jgi:integrase
VLETEVEKRILLHTKKAIAEKPNNPRLRKISFHTLRHLKRTIEYHKTKDIMHVKYVLGHKTINCTLIYINLEEATYLEDSDEWICKVAHNKQEGIELIQANFIFLNKRENLYISFYK